jgi:lipoyl(octanoyl) transferase
MIYEANWLGLTDYEKAQEIQYALADKIRQVPQIQIIGLEHPSVVTLGKRGEIATDLLWDSDTLDSRSILVKKIDRGGQATLHSQGQLVIYPLVPLSQIGLGVKDYVALLQETTLHLLKKNDIDAFIKSDPGIFTARGKIAFCGVRVDRGVTRHGISINVHNDLSLFGCIRSCGISHASLDSVQAHRPEVSLPELFRDWADLFKKEISLF